MNKYLLLLLIIAVHCNAAVDYSNMLMECNNKTKMCDVNKTQLIDLLKHYTKVTDSLESFIEVNRVQIHVTCPKEKITCTALEKELDNLIDQNNYNTLKLQEFKKNPRKPSTT